MGMTTPLPLPHGLCALMSAAALLVSADPALARCPAGSYPWLDRRGVEYCRQELIGPRQAALANEDGCPAAARTCGKDLRALESGETNAGDYLPPAPRRSPARAAR